MRERDRAGELSRVGEIAAIGIANQRETALVWERKTGAPIANAIVWQDRRTAERCAELAAEGQALVTASGPACCSTPISPPPRSAWIFDPVPGARDRRTRRTGFRHGRLFLLWRLTGGVFSHRCHQRFAHSALRYPRPGDGTTTLLALFRVPRAVLPEVARLRRRFRRHRAGWFGAPIAGPRRWPATSSRP